MNNTENNEFGMFAPTTAEEAANQSNTNRGIEVVADILKPNVGKMSWEEGDNWIRFINTRGSAWFQDVTYYEMRQGNKVARVAHHDQLFGDVNLLRAVQIGLYQNPETRSAMKDKNNPKGFQFREHRKAFMVAARWENTLSPFSVVSVTLGKQSYKKEIKYREAWGDPLIKLPAEMEIDPTLTGNPDYKPKPRWGSIFDPVDGRLIKCSLTNAGTVDISASFTPAERTFPLGMWTLNGVEIKDRPLPPGCGFTPLPQYMEVLRNVPSLKDCFRRLTIEEQKQLVRTFVPSDLLVHAERIMEAKLSEGKPATKPNSAPAAAPAPAATVQIAVPAEEPTDLDEGNKLYLEFVKALGPKFSKVGEATVRALIQKSILNAANLKFIAEFPEESLKTMAAAA